jgi:two-component system sensor histidine kinase HydH
MRRSLSLRGKFVLIVLGCAVLPLALFGLWLTRTAGRSAETLLRARLRTSMSVIVERIGTRWVNQRSQLLALCESETVQNLLAADPSVLNDDEARRLAELSAGVWSDVSFLALRDNSGTPRWTSPADSASIPTPASGSSALLPVTIDVYDMRSDSVRGTLEAHLRMGSLLPGGTEWGGVSGSVLAAFDVTTGAPLLPLSIDQGLFEQDRFFWADEPWLAERKTLYDPSLQLVLAAPLTPFIEPFEEAARRNLLLLAVVAVGGFALALGVSWPVTRDLKELAAAAEHVSAGDLDRKVRESGGDEVGRVARAFNAMLDSLRSTLRRLSQREALASVGEFAASLAHEVRNPLTSIRVDLQRLEEKLPEDPAARALLTRALGQIERVDHSVTGALRVARSGHIEAEPVDIRQPLAAAIHAARPRFEERGSILESPQISSDPLPVSGNSAALEQLFLNLLLNAAEALDRGAQASVTVERRVQDLRVSVRDSGRGIAQEDLTRVFDPFFSTKPEGTGLGLAIARRIAAAHGGELSIESTVGQGTQVNVVLPLATRPGAT